MGGNVRGYKFYIRSCPICAINKGETHPIRADLKSLPITDVFHRWIFDSVSMCLSTRQNKYMLVLVDSFSNFPEAFPMKNDTAAEVARIIFEQIICRYGTCVELCSDRATNYMGNVMKELTKLLGISHEFSAAYRHQSILAERYVQTILQSIRCSIKNQNEWEDVLPAVLMAYRGSINATTQQSPYSLVFGRPMRFPIETEVPQDSRYKTPTAHYVTDLAERLKILHSVAKENTIRAKEESKRQYDKKATKVPAFYKGQQVWLQQKYIPVGQVAKLYQRFKGPYYITSLEGERTVWLRESETDKKLKSPVNIERLKPYVSEVDFLSYNKSKAKKMRLVDLQEEVEGDQPDREDEIEEEKTQQELAEVELDQSRQTESKESKES